MGEHMSSSRYVLAALVLAAVFGGGIALGIFHANEDGAGPSGGHAAHVPAVHAHPAASESVGPPPDNPIRDEMIALQAAYDTLNRGVILGDTSGVAEAFHQVHARKQATAAAIAAGRTRPPKNADRIEAFVARDEAFHGLLEITVEAAGRDDLATLQRMTTELRDGCIGCHQEFRGEK